MNQTYTRDDLLSFPPRHTRLIGIDSDGCVFDSMEIKQKDCFHTEIIRFWNLAPIEPLLRETAEFVNLYSVDRGSNRFISLLKTFDLLQDRPEVLQSGVPLPDTESLRRYVESGLPLSNDTLAREVERTGDPDLRRILEWSLAVNEQVQRIGDRIHPFDGVREALNRMKEGADLLVVSQTPEEALVREWDQHDLHSYVHLIAGQELGTKAEHLQMAMQNRYTPERVLLIGDAPGDRKAARATGCLFYPILPGREAEAWKQFAEEGLARFAEGTYEGEYQDRQIAAFETRLPSTPPWAE